MYKRTEPKFEIRVIQFKTVHNCKPHGDDKGNQRGSSKSWGLQAYFHQILLGVFSPIVLWYSLTIYPVMVETLLTQTPAFQSADVSFLLSLSDRFTKYHRKQTKKKKTFYHEAFHKMICMYKTQSEKRLIIAHICLCSGHSCHSNIVTLAL